MKKEMIPLIIEIAGKELLPQLLDYEPHLPTDRIQHCLDNETIMVLTDGNRVVGLLRWSLFWQTIPFLDLIYLDNEIQNQGHGSEMMRQWEAHMARLGYTYVMTSTQADESAWQFYEKLGYTQIGTFTPPDQEAPELMYGKPLSA